MKKKDPWFRNRLIRDGIYKAIHEAMQKRPEIFILGEGAHMKVHFDSPDIERDFSSRVLTMPICEDASSNFAVGMSLAGIVPIVDVISSDFLYRTMDAICNTMAKASAVGHARTMIVRAEFLTGGPTSGQRIEALFAHIPGLRVAIPSNPADAYAMMIEALTYKGVTIFFEDRMIEDQTMPEAYKVLTVADRPSVIGTGARIAHLALPSDEGPKVTVVSYGITCRIAEEALRGRACTIIDLRTLYPLDVDVVATSVEDTCRLLVVEPDVTFLGIGAELIASLVERGIGGQGPTADRILYKRLGAPRATIPASRDLHDIMIPTAEQIVAAVDEMVKS
jgi:pyruvate/2-oxoglutarate/acetoin dehydrogenase E1 component